MTNDERQRILEKVRGLQAKANDAAATEAEALLFAEKAGELMAKYNLQFTELEVEKDEYDKDTQEASLGEKARHDAFNCIGAIGKLFDCKAYASQGWNDRGDKVHSATFFGTTVDTQQAHFMLALCKNAIDHELEAWKRSDEYRDLRLGGTHPRTLCNSFRKGLAFRLADRIAEMAQAKQNTMSASGGRDLVVIKSQIVAREFEAKGPRLRKIRTSGGRSGAAHSAGTRAANSVNLGKGVGRSGDRRMLN